MTQRQIRRKLQTQRRRRRIGLAIVLVTVVGVAPFAWRSLGHAVSFLPGHAAGPTKVSSNNATGMQASTEAPTTQQTSAPASAHSQAAAYDQTQPTGSAGNQTDSTNQTGNGSGGNGNGNATSSGTVTPSIPSIPEADTIAGSALKVQPETAGQNNTDSQNSSAPQPSPTQATASGTSAGSTSVGSSAGTASPSGNTTTGSATSGSGAGSASASGSQSTNAPTGVLIKVPPQNQLPELPNGCEVTSLSMLLTAVGHPVSNATLADEEPTDPTKLVLNPDKTIQFWGDPNKGFVGDVRGYGYGIYHGPIVQLINRILPGRAKDLSGQSFSALLQALNTGTPVMVWTTSNFKAEPASQWMTWNSPDGPIHATMWEHAVLLVGYDVEHLYINDPLDGAQAKQVDRSSFIAAWEQMGQQAVTIRSAT